MVVHVNEVRIDVTMFRPQKSGEELWRVEYRGKRYLISYWFDPCAGRWKKSIHVSGKGWKQGKWLSMGGPTGPTMLDMLDRIITREWTPES
jgi:hypothetical protein